MRDAPTLADMVIREWLKPEYRHIADNNALVGEIAKARKFVLDDRMSEFMADLATASLMTCDNTEKGERLINGMRQQARLPHALTWIEYNMKLKLRRARREYGLHSISTVHGRLDDEDCPERAGWLCWQHPGLETAFMAVEFSSSAYGTDGEKLALPQPNYFGYAWRTEDGPPPWPKFEIPSRIVLTPSGTRGNEHPEAILTGVGSYRSDSVRVCATPHLKPAFLEKYQKFSPAMSEFDGLAEMAGDLRYLWALLATINDLPTLTTQVHQDRGYVARGRYRKFVDHNVITLTVPTTAYKRLAQRAIAVARRRRHEVRGHFRKDWHRRPAAFCEHDWVADANEIACRHCKGRRVWVKPHERGDAGIGYVTHEYSVERGEAR